MDRRARATPSSTVRNMNYRGRMNRQEHDAVVVGAGPNGLAAAVVLARAGLSVLLLEADEQIGGGMRSAELTLPGFVHDVCSAVHPLGADSPLFTAFPLEEHGLAWVEPPIALAHPFDDEPPALLVRGLGATAASLGADGDAYLDLMTPLLGAWPTLVPDLLAPLHWPRHPIELARFGVRGIQSVSRLVHHHFRSRAARALLGGIASHGMQPLTEPGTAALALVLATAGHRVGWPVARGGSQAIADALASYLRQLGGRIEVGRPVLRRADLPPARATLLDIAPHQAVEIFGEAFSGRYARGVRRFQYGPGVCKVDWALSSPAPWTRAPCRDAGTLHLVGSFEALAANEVAVAHGEHPDQPTVLVSQPSCFDPTRAPRDGHTLWGYCHVPNGSTVDMTARIEAQIERFAPGFRDCISARHVMTATQVAAREPNMLGGDIAQGANTLRQLFFRPMMRRNPYSTPVDGVYLCSSSTPPGGGVHGMCGYHAAASALADVFGIDVARTTVLGPPIRTR